MQLSVIAREPRKKSYARPKKLWQRTRCPSASIKCLLVSGTQLKSLGNMVSGTYGLTRYVLYKRMRVIGGSSPRSQMASVFRTPLLRLQQLRQPTAMAGVGSQDHPPYIFPTSPGVINQKQYPSSPSYVLQCARNIHHIIPPYTNVDGNRPIKVGVRVTTLIKSKGAKGKGKRYSNF